MGRSRLKHPVVAIIQARMGSQRLPRKVLADIEGQTMLERVIRRTQLASSIDQVVVATSDLIDDEMVAVAAQNVGVHVTRGSEEDVLDRYRQAARESGALTIVRISADSPLVDPEVTNSVVDAFLSNDVDYASNKLEPSFPLGLDVEAFSRDALEKTWSEASEPYERAHVTVRMYASPVELRLMPVRTSPDRHHMRWTVDTQEDLTFVREVFRAFDGRNDFSWLDVVELVEREPALAAINSNIRAKAIQEG
jgi:spore coat polysaccharide biosynthesis protein SpsF (cytidylyltransferase family)